MKRAVLTMAVVGLLPALVRADDIQTWFQRMATAAQTTNYTGDFVYIRADRLHNMRIVHAVDEQGEHERLTALDGPQREYLRDGGITRWRVPKAVATSLPRRPSSDNNFSFFLPDRLADVQSRYQLVEGPTERVAGRQTQVLDVVPRDDLRFGYRLWVDREHDLLLKARMTDLAARDGRQVLEQFTFTTVDFPGRIPVDQWRPADLDDERVWIAQGAPNGHIETSNIQRTTAQSMRALLGAKPGPLPAGFSLVRSVALEPAGARQLVFTDGLAVVSVFIEPRTAGGQAITGLQRRGLTTIYGKTLDHYQITALGEVPDKTVTMMVKAVQSALGGSVQEPAD